MKKAGELEAFCKKQNWQNIQEVVKLILTKTAAVVSTLDRQVNELNTELQQCKLQLQQKADVIDVQQGMSEVILKVDSRKRVSDLEQTLMSMQQQIKERLDNNDGSVSQSMAVQHKLSCQVQSVGLGLDELRLVQQKQIAQVYRDIEHFKSKPDLSNVELKSLEYTVSQKPDLKQVQSLVAEKCSMEEVSVCVGALDLKFEDHFVNIEALVQRKACAQDVHFLRREQSFKASKNELEIVKQELLRAINDVGFQLGKVELKVKAAEENWEMLVESKIRGVESRVAERLESSLSQFKAKPLKPKTVQPTDDLRETIKMIVEDREQDITKTAELLQTHVQQINGKLAKFQFEMSQQIEDKVRVDEVQGALKKLADGFKLSFQQFDELQQVRVKELQLIMQQKYESAIDRLKRPYDEVLGDLKELGMKVEIMNQNQK